MIAATGNQYLIAKYAPDLLRMEPRNIGIIFWNRGNVVARFLDAEDVDFIADEENYRYWVQHWQYIVSNQEIRIGRRRPVTAASPRFLSELRRTGSENYQLEEGGLVVEEVARNDTTEAIDFLFNRLVAPDASRTSATQEATFPQRCESLLTNLGWTSRLDFSRNISIPVKINGIPDDLRIHYALLDPKRPVFMHRVTLQREESLTSTAFRFEWARRTKFQSAEPRCFAFYSLEAGEVERQQNRLRWLGQFATPVNILDHDHAAEVLNTAL